jgi:hypothetical protein
MASAPRCGANAFASLLSQEDGASRCCRMNGDSAHQDAVADAASVAPPGERDRRRRRGAARPLAGVRRRQMMLLGSGRGRGAQRQPALSRKRLRANAAAQPQALLPSFQPHRGPDSASAAAERAAPHDSGRPRPLAASIRRWRLGKAGAKLRAACSPAHSVTASARTSTGPSHHDSEPSRHKLSPMDAGRRQHCASLSAPSPASAVGTRGAGAGRCAQTCAGIAPRGVMRNKHFAAHHRGSICETACAGRLAAPGP